MVKVKIFGVIRSTTGFGYLEVDTDNKKITVLDYEGSQGYIWKAVSAQIVVGTEVKETVSKYENVEATLLSSSTGFIMDKESLMVKSLVNAYQEVTKDYESKPICSAGGTYAREFKNKLMTKGEHNNE